MYEFYYFAVHTIVSFSQENCRKVTWAVKLTGNSQLLCSAEQSLNLSQNIVHFVYIEARSSDVIPLQKLTNCMKVAM